MVCQERKEMPTKSGLCIFLDVARDTLNAYEKKDEYSDTLKKIYNYIEERWTQSLMKAYPTGSIFYLKNTFGWADKVEQTSTVNHQVFFVPKEIADKHSLVLPEAEPEKKARHLSAEDVKVIEPEQPEEVVLDEADPVNAAT